MNNKWIAPLTFITLFIGIATSCKKDPGPSAEDPFVPTDVMAHYTFEGTPNDIAGTFNPQASDIIDVAYTDSYSSAAGKAASFNGTSSIIEIPDGDKFLSHLDFSIAFWVKASSTKNGHFVFGLAGQRGFHFEIDSASWASSTKYVKLTSTYDGVDSLTREDQIWNGNGQTKTNGGWQGTNVNKKLTGGNISQYFADKWAHVVVTYNKQSRVNAMFVNGEKVKEFDFDQWPDWDVRRKVVGVRYNGNPAPGNKLALGFIQGRENRVMPQSWANYKDQFSNHFLGQLDDLWIFSKALTDIEAMQLYNSEKPDGK